MKPRCALVKSEGRPQAAFDFIFREPGTDASETCRLLILIHRRLRRYLHLPRRGKFHCAKRIFTCPKDRFHLSPAVYALLRLIALNSAWMEAAMISSFTPAPQETLPSGRVMPT